MNLRSKVDEDAEDAEDTLTPWQIQVSVKFNVLLIMLVSLL